MVGFSPNAPHEITQKREKVAESLPPQSTWQCAFNIVFLNLPEARSKMKKSIFIYLLAYLPNFQFKEIEYKEGSKIDPKYSLPKVNLSASDGNHTVPASLARVLNFYNTEILAANWDRMRNLVTLSCRKDVELYLDGLGKMENWALKSK